jgi:bifunctional non-homologous end joining protein LigD
MAGSSAPQTVILNGHRLRLTHPDKIVYPETGTTKAEVMHYLVAIAPTLLPHLRDRVVTRKRWVGGVGTLGHPGAFFFEKNLPRSAPRWIRRQEVQHHGHEAVYPIVERPADLAWLGQVNALELHVPQWRVSPDGTPAHPDRLVLDLDPGPGAGLAECAAVAHEARSLLEDVGLTALPVTSGSKGIHLYAALDGTHDSDYINTFAKTLAKALESQLPELVVSSMIRSVRRGKVLVDWSQNNGNKTTLSPYSLRGTPLPHVAAPRFWDEIDDDLKQLLFSEVLDRVTSAGDPLAELATAMPTDDEPAAAAHRTSGQDRSVMLASTGHQSAVSKTADWAYEMKWDGIRAVASVDPAGVHVVTRNGNDVTDSYPEIAKGLRSANLGTLVLDGEIVAFDRQGAPDFGRLQQRMGRTRPIDVASAATRVPVHYLAFDLLEQAGRSLRSQTYDDRRNALDALRIGTDTDDVVRVPPAFAGELKAAIASSLEQGLEGVIAKRRGSTYRAGRSTAWVKIKHQRMQDVVICGWSPGHGTRHDVVGSLILGVHRDGRLVYAGRVGTGFSDSELTSMRDLLDRFPAADCPVLGVPDEIAREAQWVEPRFVGEVTFAEWTNNGHLRHATWRGLRPDVSPSDVLA